MDIFKKLEENGITASGHFSGHFWGQDTHLSWVLTDDGVLTIVGKGNLDDIVEDFEWRLDDTDYKCRNYNYPTGCSYPWFAYYDLVKAVVFGEGIENLGRATFMCYRNIEKLMFPNSLKSLGFWAFYGCTSLTEVAIPANVVDVSSAFSYCCNLKRVTCLANHPPIIDKYTFDDIAKEAELYVPGDSVEEYKQNYCWNKSFKQIKGILYGRWRGHTGVQ